MARSTRNSGTRWTGKDNALLRRMIKENTPTGVMTIYLGRSKDAIYSQASKEGLSVKPTNQSPYGTRKK